MGAPKPSVLGRIAATLRFERENRLVTWGALITHVPVGLTAYFGNFFPYLYSYFYVYSPETVQVFDPLWIASSWRIFTPVGMFLGGFLETRFGSSRVLALSGFLLTTFLFISFFAIDNAALLMLTFGFFCGLATGMNYSLSYKLINVTAADKKGLYSGIMGMISTSCDALIIWLTYVIINPANEEPDGGNGPISYYTQPDIIERVPYFFAMLGAMNLVCQLLGCCMVRGYEPASEPELTKNFEDEVEDDSDNEPSTKESLDLPQKEEDARLTSSSLSKNKKISIDKSEKLPILPKNSAASSSSIKHNYSLRQVLKSKLFYAILVLFFLFKHTCYIQTNLYKQYGQEYIHSDRLLTYAGILSQVFSIVIRIFNGIFIDRIGSKVALVVLLAMCCLFMSLLPLSLWVWAPLFIGLAPIETALAVLNFQQVSIFVFDSFGPSQFSALIGLVHIPQIVLAFIEPELIPFITRHLGMNYVFMTGAITVFISFLMSLPMPDRSGVK